MPMPHRTFAQVARRRLAGKEGRERVREVRALLDELPDYRNGPYGELRKWLLGEIEETRVRSGAVHRDSIAVRREGAAQVALVGPPNVGKSSLLQALSAIRIRTGDYAFTTLRPVPAVTRIGGVLVQLVEIPGLVEGANDDRGGGRALLGVLRSADAIVYCARADADPAQLAPVRDEVALAGIEKPALVAATRADEARPGFVDRLRAASPGLRRRRGVRARRPVARRAPGGDLGPDRARPRPPAARATASTRSRSPCRGARPWPTWRASSTGSSGRRSRPGVSGAHPRASTASSSAAGTWSSTATWSRWCAERPARAAGYPAAAPGTTRPSASSVARRRRLRSSAPGTWSRAW